MGMGAASGWGFRELLRDEGRMGRAWATAGVGPAMASRHWQTCLRHLLMSIVLLLHIPPLSLQWQAAAQWL